VITAGSARPSSREWASPFVYAADGALRYRWPTLVVCLAVAAPLLVWLFGPLFERRRPLDPASAPASSCPSRDLPACPDR